MKGGVQVVCSAPRCRHSGDAVHLGALRWFSAMHLMQNSALCNEEEPHKAFKSALLLTLVCSTY